MATRFDWVQRHFLQFDIVMLTLGVVQADLTNIRFPQIVAPASTAINLYPQVEHTECYPTKCKTIGLGILGRATGQICSGVSESWSVSGWTPTVPSSSFF